MKRQTYDYKLQIPGDVGNKKTGFKHDGSLADRLLTFCESRRVKLVAFILAAIEEKLAKEEQVY